MEPDQPDPIELILDLVRRLPPDLLQQVSDWLHEVTGDRYVFAQTAEVSVTPGALTIKTGTATGTFGFRGHARGTVVTPPAPQPLWGRPELLIVGFVVFVVLAFHDKPFTDGLADALWELSLLLIALGLGYRRE
jgi:hypothetical protein